MIQTKLSATRTLSYEVWLAESSILEGKVDDTPPAPCGCCSLALLRLMLEGKIKEDHAFLPQDRKDGSCAVEIVFLVLAVPCDPSSGRDSARCETQSNGS
jgi:hypothetical protein